MQNVLLVAILGIAFVFLVLTLVIVAAKAWRQVRDRWRRARRRVLEPVVLAYAHGTEVSLLADLGGGVAPKDRAVMEEILLDHIQRVRGIERERLGRALDELGYVNAYLRGLKSSRWWKRAESAEHLGLAGATRATGELLAAMDDESYEVRLRAAKALGAIGGRAAVGPLLRALSEPNRWSTIRVADILGGMGREVVHELMEGFGALSRHGKLAAIDILGRVHSLESVPWLVARLTDPESDVRARVCAALGAIGVIDAGPELRKALADRAWPVRAMAAKAIGKIHDAEAIPELCGALRDGEWWVRANAAEALKMIGPMGIEALEGMLDDADLYAKHQACLMLEESGILDRRVAQLAGTGAVRAAAESVVTRVIRAGQVGRLRELAVHHADPAVRAALARLLPPVPALPSAGRVAS
jgi:HEAT repeat protein